MVLVKEETAKGVTNVLDVRMNFLLPEHVFESLSILQFRVMEERQQSEKEHNVLLQEVCSDRLQLSNCLGSESSCDRVRADDTSSVISVLFLPKTNCMMLQDVRR